MIDREARDKMSSIIRSYMAESITAFALDEQLGKIQTDDRTAREVRFMMWFHYDDITDHLVHATREQWQLFNRLLLLLDSPFELQKSHCRVWHGAQWVAVLSFLAILGAIGYWGIENIFLIWPTAAPPAAWLYCRRRARLHSLLRPSDRLAFPFSSFKSLAQCRRQLPTFIKLRYPPAVAERRMPRRVFDFRLYRWFSVTMLAIGFGPFILLWASFPIRHNDHCVRPP